MHRLKTRWQVVMGKWEVAARYQSLEHVDMRINFN
jgi:hypothetical protein